MERPEEDEIREVGRELAGHLAPPRSPLRAVDERALDIASHDAALRAALFRFVDVVPACRSFDDLAAHLVGYLSEVEDHPVPVDVALKMGNTRAGRAALGTAAAAGVRHVAHRFIVAESPREAERTLRSLWRGGVATSLDLLGEATVTTAEADRYALRCKDALRVLAELYDQLPAQPSLERDSLGPIPRANLSVKVSALTPLLRPEAPELGERDAEPRLLELLRQARASGAHLHVDMESFDTLRAGHRARAVTALARGVPRRSERRGRAAGIPARLRRAVQRILDWARSAGRTVPLVVRLVKGAYWDHEVVQARQQGWRAPVFEQKAECDRNFEALTLALLQGRPYVRPAIASHNLRSVAHAIVAHRETAAGRAAIWSSRCCAGWAIRCRRRSFRPDTGSAPTARSGISSRAWHTSCAGCSRTPPTRASSSSSASGRPLEQLLAAP